MSAAEDSGILYVEDVHVLCDQIYKFISHNNDLNDFLD